MGSVHVMQVPLEVRTVGVTGCCEPPTGHAAGAEAISPVPYRSFYLLIFTANVCCFIIEDEIQELDSNFFFNF